MIISTVSFDFLKRLRTLPSWPEMCYAFQNQIIPVATVIDYAKEKVIANSSADPDELSIAKASANESIVESISRLSESSGAVSEEESRLYWANILLTWIYENRTSIGDVLGLVEEIYSDFDYPYALAPFVRYMPSNSPNLGSREANEERMIASIGEYIEQFTCV